MYSIIIELDKDKIAKNGYSYEKITNFIDWLYTKSSDVIKESEGHYVGVTGTEDEFAHIMSPLMTLCQQKWFREIVTRWELWENGAFYENIIETIERREKDFGKKFYEGKEELQRNYYVK